MTATQARTKPTAHPFTVDPDVPGTCVRCRLIKGNRVHDPDAVKAVQAQAHAAQAEERRRAGEPED